MNTVLTLNALTLLSRVHYPKAYTGGCICKPLHLEGHPMGHRWRGQRSHFASLITAVSCLSISQSIAPPWPRFVSPVGPLWDQTTPIPACCSIFEGLKTNVRAGPHESCSKYLGRYRRYKNPDQLGKASGNSDCVWVSWFVYAVLSSDKTLWFHEGLGSWRLGRTPPLVPRAKVEVKTSPSVEHPSFSQKCDNLGKWR